MENDKGAYFMLTSENEGQLEYNTYDNAEAARKAARIDEQENPDNTRRLYKVLPNTDPIEVML